jgi:hypothetical protein
MPASVTRIAIEVPGLSVLPANFASVSRLPVAVRFCV